MAKNKKGSVKFKETDIASKIVEWLEFNGWVVYKEVSMYGTGGDRRIDILAVKDGIYFGIETKSVFNFQVMCQANKWSKNLHKVAVAVPNFSIQKKDHSDLNLAASICKDFLDIGLIQVDTRTNKNTFRNYSSEINLPLYYQNSIKVTYDPHPKEPKSKLPKLFEEQKDSEAGNNKGEFFTVFKGTIKKINDFLQDKDEYDFKIMLETIEHHYSNINSAKSQLSKFVGTLIPGFEMEMRGRKSWIVRIKDQTSV